MAKKITSKTKRVANHYDFVILGAGVAGLAFAWKMVRAGKRVLILEKEATVGGLSRTLKKGKFYMDFSAHRFHTGNPELLKEIFSLKNLKMYKHIKKSRIYMFNKFLKYPFELPNLFRAMPPHQLFKCSLDFIQHKLLKMFQKKESKIVSYKDWFVKQYGTELYKVMCEPYTSKIWRMDPSLISADWADQRIGKSNLSKLVARAIKKILTLDFSSYDLKDDALAPDGGEFYYPKLGIQEMPDAFASEVLENGGKIMLSSLVTKINKKRKEVEYKTGPKARPRIVKYDNIISTIPLSVLHYLTGEKNAAIERSFKQTRYMDIIFIYLFVNKKTISNDHWLYFPDKNIPFNRAVEFKSWSKDMAPRGKTCVCLDTTCFFGDETWNKTDKTLARECIEASDRVGYIPKKKVTGYHVERIRFAYPVYDIGYRKRLQNIVGHLENRGMYLLGRTGIFRYNNSDNSIEMAFQMANNFINKGKEKSVFEYKMKKVSL